MARAEPHDAGGARGRRQANQHFELHLDFRERQCCGHGVTRRRPESLLVEFLAAEGLDRGDGGEGLLDDLINSSFDRLLLITAVQHRLGVEAKNQGHPRHHGERDQRQRGIDAPQEGKHGREPNQRENHRQERVLHNGGGARRVGGDAADVVADRLTGVKTKRQPLQLGKQIRRQIIDHPLPEVDVRIRVRQTQRPTEQEDEDRRADAPGDQVGRAVRTRQALQDAREGGPGLSLKHVIDQENHRPRFQQIQANLHQHGERHGRERRPAAQRVAQRPPAEPEHVQRLRGFSFGHDFIPPFRRPRVSTQPTAGANGRTNRPAKAVPRAFRFRQFDRSPAGRCGRRA